MVHLDYIFGRMAIPVVTPTYIYSYIHLWVAGSTLDCNNRDFLSGRGLPIGEAAVCGGPFVVCGCLLCVASGKPLKPGQARIRNGI